MIPPPTLDGGAGVAIDMVDFRVDLIAATATVYNYIGPLAPEVDAGMFGLGRSQKRCRR